MNKKLLTTIIIIIIIAAVSGVTAFVYFSNPNVQYNNIKMSESCSMDIPVSNKLTNTTIGDNISVINDTQHDLIIMYYNSNSDNLSSDLSDGVKLASTRDSYKIGAEQQTLNNQSVWYNKDTKYYMAFLGNDTTHDNILIVTKNKDILTHIMTSIHYFQVNTTVSTDSVSTTTSSPKTSHKNKTNKTKEANTTVNFYEFNYYDDSNYDYDSASGSASSSGSGSSSSGSSGSEEYSYDDYDI
ncbi:MAG: hypothetical protein PUC09_06250 [Methanobrevibacter wolinii]|nr:hypothetical protein [Methanobrevibacter wolinii]